MEESGATGQGRGLAAGWQGLIASLCSAVLYVLAFPPFDVAETAYVFALPVMLWGLFGRPLRREGWLLLGSGWLAWAVLLSWLRHCTQIFDTFWAAPLGWLLVLALSAAVGLFWGLWSWAALVLMRATREGALVSRLLVVAGLAGLWVVMEWIRGTILTGFPWLPLGASQWQRPLLLQVASLTGAAGIAFVLITFNAGLAYYLHRLWHHRRSGWLKRLSPEFYLGLGLLMAAIGFGLHTSGVGRGGKIIGPRLGFVQPDVSVLGKWDMERMRDNLATLSDLSTYAGYLGADLILWPESPTPLPVKGDPYMQEWADDLTRRLGIPILMGNIARETIPQTGEVRWYNAVLYASPETGVDVEHFYAKRRLVPFGEYVPLARVLPFIRKLVPMAADFSPGDQVQLLPVSGGAEGMGEVGSLICYEDVFPHLARANVRAGADWHFVATNNVWFGEEAAAWQHAAHSVLRAVETRRPVVRCGNAGWSGWIDEFGNIRHAMLNEKGSIYFQGVEAADFFRNRYWSGRRSPYVLYGDWLVPVSAVLAVLALSLLIRRRLP